VAFYQQCNGLEQDGLASAWLQSVLFSSQALTYDQTQMLAEGFAARNAQSLPAEEAADPFAGAVTQEEIPLEEPAEEAPADPQEPEAPAQQEDSDREPSIKEEAEPSSSEEASGSDAAEETHEL
jgi:hypothetical protein